MGKQLGALKGHDNQDYIDAIQVIINVGSKMFALKMDYNHVAEYLKHE
jgi:hypothetical protein